MTRRGTALIVLGVLMLLGSGAAAQRGSTAFMNVFNFTLAALVLLWGLSYRLERLERT
jgi:hypothetical protein